MDVYENEPQGVNGAVALTAEVLIPAGAYLVRRAVQHSLSAVIASAIGDQRSANRFRRTAKFQGRAGAAAGAVGWGLCLASVAAEGLGK